MSSGDAKAYAEFKLQQARESLAEARGLLEDGAELRYVVNSLYYGFYYPILALLHTRDYEAGMQSVSLALFEKEFVRTGVIEKRFSDAARRAFDLKPKCSGGGLITITRQDVESLLTIAEDFIHAVSRRTEAS